MSPERWTYPDELGEALLTFGPRVVRDALNDLYRFELRRMRDRLRAGLMERPEYLDRVVALRKKYWPLTLPLGAWERICRGRIGN